MEKLIRALETAACVALLAGGGAMSARGNTYVVTNTAASGDGSLLAAITNANANAGLSTITFNISGTPPFTISPSSPLPAISVPLIIDATSQHGYVNKPVVELSGASAGGSAVGIRFSLGSDGSVLRGLAINRFPAQGIDISSASGIAIQGNFIGTDVTGTAVRGNGSGNSAPGIYVKSSGNLIGGTNAGDGNLISGGNFIGIYLQNAGNNVVQGNIIGLTAAGTGGLGNLNNGILINPGLNNLIGGPFAAAGNVISGNGASGVYVNSASSSGNVIQGNYLGTDITGTTALGNAGDGATINTSAANLISSNLISGNVQAGISLSGAGTANNHILGNFIGTDITGTAKLGNSYAGVQISGGTANQIGDGAAGDGNVISGNVLDGIAVTNSTLNTIQGNLIGVNAAGTVALANGRSGISIGGANSNTVGGVSSSARNIISGNPVYGVVVLQITDKGNQIEGNYIGTDVTGTKAIPNTQSGVQIQGSGNIVGGVVPGAGNVISGNGQIGIYLVGSSGNVSSNAIQGNLIGLNAAGTQALGNTIAGIGLVGAANNLIGGATSSARNVISGNGNSVNGDGGIFLAYNGASANQLQGNYIGTDISGNVAVGNVNAGIFLATQSGTNFIGGSAAGAGNLISGNGLTGNLQGIFLTNSSGNVIQGNFIGTKADGVSALGNVGHSVELQADANNNIIGGTASGAGNHIAFTQTALRSGIRIRNGSYNNLISGNSIFNNAELGIDLGFGNSGTYGVTANVDCESGMTSANANFGQNYPVLTDVYSGAGSRVRGALDAKTGRSYTLQFFASPSGNALGYGEGQIFLGQTNLTLGTACTSNFVAYLSASVPPGWVVTATATDPNNNTSEFSAWISVIPVPPLHVALAAANQLSLSWTNNGGNFGLQQTFTLTPPVWRAVTNLPVLVNNSLVTTLSATNNSAYYRLTPL